MHLLKPELIFTLGVKNRAVLVQIGFSSQKWEKVCTDPKAAAKVIPPDKVQLLIERLEHLAAFDNMSQLRPGGTKDWHALKGDRSGQWSLTLNKPWAICVVPAGEYTRKDSGEIDYSTVTAVEVVFVGNYHKG
ncbi:hypothetical protein KQI52_16080 [bacterium]|nr:hypothetical protein [bacterium]